MATNCLQCGKELHRSKRFCSCSCTAKYYKPHKFAGPVSQETRNKISKAQKGIPEKDWVKKQTSEIMLKFYEENPEKGKISRQKQLAKRWADPNQHILTSKRLRDNNPMANPVIREKHRNVMAGEEFRRKQKERGIELSKQDWWLKKCLDEGSLPLWRMNLSIC